MAASELLKQASALGAAGPPVDVFALAAGIGIGLVPKDDLIDAQIAAHGSDLIIEYNPNRPRGRLRFSIAHEIAHSRFGDVADQPRHRTAAGSVAGANDTDDWELELLCDVVAADLLLPRQAIEGILTVDPDIDFLMDVRRRWDVSTEALLRRVVSATPRPLMMVATSRPTDNSNDVVRVDYATRSRSAIGALPDLGHGDRLSKIDALLACTAVGQTARGTVQIANGDFLIQAVGIPAYPGRKWPRVLALIEPLEERREIANLQHVTSDVLAWGDSTDSVLVAHVVSDSVRGWNRFGVAGALTRAFPNLAGSYRAWTVASPEHLQLGSVHYVETAIGERKIGVASLVVQAGYGRGEPVRLRYDALSDALAEVA
ncbi:MAG: hypothetical protein JWP75_3860, partial [Frondihabitans sp.]|nr:hypothetical protein [Frondihabitans sp.]